MYNIDPRQSFLRMTDQEKMAALYDMITFIRSDVATAVKNTIVLRDDLETFQRETRKVRAAREEKELQEETTIDKIEKVLSKRFDAWVYFRDRILPTILTLIITGILYAVFRGNIP